MHEGEFFHEHLGLSEEQRREIGRYIWKQETVELNTVGIDIGSSTAHLLFARVVMQRQVQELSSRFVMVSREVVWRSPVILTPFLPDGTIDAHRLGHFIHDAYAQAGFKSTDIDSGAVILTGEAIKQKNARAIDELFAGEGGKFVCATAGHKLESMLAAHGSGAVRLSKERSECVLHVDIGGGTTKLALIDRGKILGVSAFAVGGRLLARDPDGMWTRVDDSARLVAQELGMPTDPETLAHPESRRQIARRLASIAVDYILGVPLDDLAKSLQLTESLSRSICPVAVTVSGGVSEYLFGREGADYGDIAKLLSAELSEQLRTRLPLVLIDPGQGIRATVIGASQFTVQVSGKTIYLPNPAALPVHNVPVVHVGVDFCERIDPEAVVHAIGAGLKRMDLTPDSRVAIAFSWNGDPEYARLASMSRAIVRAVAPGGHRDQLLLLMIDGDVGKTFGHLLHCELGLSGDIISVDGVQLRELDFVDVGEMISPPGVVPVVIKSLLFS